MVWILLVLGARFIKNNLILRISQRDKHVYNTVSNRWTSIILIIHNDRVVRKIILLQSDCNRVFDSLELFVQSHFSTLSKRLDIRNFEDFWCVGHGQKPDAGTLRIHQFCQYILKYNRFLLTILIRVLTGSTPNPVVCQCPTSDGNGAP